MKLVFQNSQGHERTIADVATADDAYSEIKNSVENETFTFIIPAFGKTMMVRQSMTLGRM